MNGAPTPQSVTEAGWPQIIVGLVWFPVQILIGLWVTGAATLGLISGSSSTLGISGSARSVWGVIALPVGGLIVWSGCRLLRRTVRELRARLAR
jgi:hypothetical protein